VFVADHGMGRHDFITASIRMIAAELLHVARLWNAYTMWQTSYTNISPA